MKLASQCVLLLIVCLNGSRLLQNTSKDCKSDRQKCSDGRSVGRDPANNCEFEPCPEKGDYCGTVAAGNCDGVRDASFTCPIDYKCACWNNCGICTYQDDGNGNLVCSATITPRSDVCPPKDCKKDSKLCSDGKTYVGRDPNNGCRFKPCPKIPCSIDKECDLKTGFKCSDDPMCRVDCYGKCKENHVCLMQKGECKSDNDCNTEFYCEGIDIQGIGICTQYQGKSTGSNEDATLAPSSYIKLTVEIIAILLLFNTISICYVKRDHIKIAPKNKAYSVVKMIDSEDLTDAEMSPMDIN